MVTKRAGNRPALGIQHGAFETAGRGFGLQKPPGDNEKRKGDAEEQEETFCGSHFFLRADFSAAGNRKGARRGQACRK